MGYRDSVMNVLIPQAMDHRTSLSELDSWIPPGQLTSPWKDPPFLMGKSTISTAIFNSFLYVYQRVSFRVPQISSVKMKVFELQLADFHRRFRIACFKSVMTDLVYLTSKQLFRLSPNWKITIPKIGQSTN